MDSSTSCRAAVYSLRHATAGFQELRLRGQVQFGFQADDRLLEVVPALLCQVQIAQHQPGAQVRRLLGHHLLPVLFGLGCPPLLAANLPQDVVGAPAAQPLRTPMAT